MHHLSVNCQDCDFHIEWQVDTDILGYSTRCIIGDQRAILTDDAYNKLLSYITEFHQHLSDTSHSGVILKHTHACLDTPNEALIRLDTFQSWSRGQFSRMIADYIRGLIGRSEVVKRDLEMIDSLIRTDADAETLRQLREQGYTNRQIIKHFLDMSWERSQAPKEGQSHLELDETTLKSTGKSVSIEEFIAKIDKQLKEKSKKT